MQVLISRVLLGVNSEFPPDAGKVPDFSRSDNNDESRFAIELIGWFFVRVCIVDGDENAVGSGTRNVNFNSKFGARRHRGG